MNFKRPLFTRVLAVLMLAFCCASQCQADIIPNTSLPKSHLFYTWPVDTLDAMWEADVYRYYKAKELRNDSIKESLNADRQYVPDSMLRRQAPGLGFMPSDSAARSLYRLVIDSWNNYNSNASLKLYVKRVRPCRRFREPTFGVEYQSEFSDPTSRSSYSYPSSHSSNSWGIALLLLGTAPWQGDTIVSRGIAHGQSRVIGGVHWQSDVDAGKILASDVYARFFAESAFLTRFDTAKSQVRQLLGHDTHPSFDQLLSSDDSLSLLVRSLPLPYPMHSLVGSAEMSQTIQKISQRTEAQVTAAKQQMDLSTENVFRFFAPTLGATITADTHPATFELLDKHLRMCRKLCQTLAERNDKCRPSEIFPAMPLPTGEDADSLCAETPYPSLHAAAGWTAGLVTMILNPERQDELLKLGLSYGNNRVAMGTTWQGDVDMGRIVAGIAFAYVTSCAEYTDCVRAAKAEFSSTSLTAENEMP